MTITEHIRGQVVVLEIQGRMTIEARESELSRLVRERLSDGRRTFLLDLGDVPYSDSRGLSELVVALTDADGAGATLRLARLQPHVRKLLDAAGLSHLFQIYDSVDEALEGLDT